jgi:hypothetical protein
MGKVKRPWHLSPEGSARRNKDIEFLRSRLHNITTREREGRLAVEGDITVSLSAETSWSGRIRVTFPRNYPASQPWAYILGSSFQPRDVTRHFMSDGACCLNLPYVDDDWVENGEHALSDWFDQVTLFIARQMLYDVLRRWVGPFWPHGLAAYALHVEEVLVDPELVINFYSYRRRTDLGTGDECPCGSGARFGDCHQETYRKLLLDVRGRREKEMLNGSAEKPRPE